MSHSVLSVNLSLTIATCYCNLQGGGTEFEVLESSGVKDARKKLEATSVDFICSDYNMRDGMGLDLLHYCKEMNTSTPFVLMSAYDLDQLSRKAELFGISFCEKTDGTFFGKLKAAL